MFNTGNCSVPLVASIDGNGNNGNGFGDGGWASTIAKCVH